MSTIKACEQFMNYDLAKMIGFFKSHVIEVLEDEKSGPHSISIFCESWWLKMKEVHRSHGEQSEEILQEKILSIKE